MEKALAEHAALELHIELAETGFTVVFSSNHAAEYFLEFHATGGMGHQRGGEMSGTIQNSETRHFVRLNFAPMAVGLVAAKWVLGAALADQPNVATEKPSLRVRASAARQKSSRRARLRVASTDRSGVRRGGPYSAYGDDAGIYRSANRTDPYFYGHAFDPYSGRPTTDPYFYGRDLDPYRD
jgi:hypothetical protein